MPYAKRINPCGFILRHLTGGFALAASWAGIKTVQFVEIDPFCQKVLRKNFPGVPIHDDIKTFTNAKCSRFNGQTIPIQSRESQQEGSLPTGCNQRPFLLTGGFPCQPFSCAGKRKGTGDDRHLWPHMLRVIKEVNPEWIIGENVGGIINIKNLVEQGGDVNMEDEADNGGEDSGSTSVIVSILSDLNQAGYSVQLFLIPACAVGAPHRRDRVWIVAYSKSIRSERRPCQVREEDGRQVGRMHSEFDGADRHAPDTSDKGLQRGEKAGNTSVDRKESRNELLGGCPDWEEPWLEVATRLCRVDDGVSRGVDRVNRLKALGNAVVPQIPYLIMKAILEES